jgi:hypothetical protein
MYHPGKVIDVFKPADKKIKSADASTQALLDMWDENIMTLLVDPKIANELKKDDVVLVDYRLEEKTGPRQIITKILYGDVAEKIWKEYKEYWRRRKPTTTSPPGFG